MEPMLGQPLLDAELPPPQSARAIPPKNIPPITLLDCVTRFRHLRTLRRFGELLKAHASSLSPHARCAGCNGHVMFRFLLQKA
jgi:hypothetical protein